jgi:hypothetical protein
MVNKGIAFIESAPETGMYRTGATCLAGLTVLKVTANADHPKVVQGVQVAKQVIRGASAGNKETHIVYDVCVASMLLAAVNPEVNRFELETARDWLVNIQKANGGHGYLDRETGDTSQVQYAMLAFWSLDKAGVPAPVTTLESSIGYLQTTQDPSGSWGYQGILGKGSLVAQTEATKSLGTAGICALLLACDQLNLIGSRTKDQDGIPKAFERIDTTAKGAGRGKVTLKRDDVDNSIALAFRYQEKSGPHGDTWHYYWRYSQERYESLRELSVGKQEKSPTWYNQGVDDLAKKQRADGAWNGIAASPSIDTCLAILFLIRSTQKSIGQIGEGIGFGGQGIPLDVTSIRMQGDKIVSEKDMSVENLLSLMEDKENQVSEGMLPKNLVLSKNPQERAQQTARLSRLLDSEDAMARRLAARLLGRCEDLGVVPDLIYALSDNDGEVPVLAEESLRLLSRHLSKVHFKQSPTDEQKSISEKYWRAWYLTVRPDYVFIERK